MCLNWNKREFPANERYVAADAIIGLRELERECGDMGRFANGILECLTARAI